MFPQTLALLIGNVMCTIADVLIVFVTATGFVLKILLEDLLKFYNLWSRARKLPGPAGLPVLGNLLDVMGNTESLLKQLDNWVECYSSPFRIWLGPKLHIVLYDAESIKEMLQKQKVIEKLQVHSIFGKFFGNGLITSTGKEWRAHRKLINTVFNGRVLPPYGAFLTEKAQEMVKEMEVEVHGKGFEIYHYVSVCTSRMIFGVILGTSLNFESEELRSFYDDLNRCSEIIFVRLPRIWLYPDIIFNRTALGKENNKILERLSATMKKAIDQADADKDIATANTTTPANKSLPGLFMNLPRDRDDFIYQEFLYELNTIIAAGFHSVTAQIDSMTRMLAYHPDIQDKVYNELYSIYGSSDAADRPVTFEDLPRMEYLECVIHESMRLFPPVGFFARAINKDTDLGSCVLPAGSTVIINILSLHRNEKYWPDPLKFNPDRFLPENVAKRIPGAYIPFSIGPRNCIGNKYAIMVGKLLLASILRRYILRVDTIVPIENIRLKGNIVLECVEPWCLRIEERTRCNSC